MLKLQGYTIKEKINRNPEVEIHRAIDPNNLDVVIKYIPYTSSKQALNNLKKEYDFIHSLSEDSVIKTYGFISWEEGLTLILEDGGISLREYCKKHGKLSVEEFLDLSIRLTKIISFLHKNRIVHKDIKPSNFVINPISGTIKIIDFGISTRLNLEETGWKSQNILDGSLPYISPEQTGRVNRLIDYRTDFYSLGITLYELITGNLPFENIDPVELVYLHMTKIPTRVSFIRDDIPEMIDLIIQKLMEKDADKRYKSTLGIIHDLEKCLLEYKENGKVNKFALGEKDFSDRFQIPQKIYGRENEINTLLEVFNKAAIGSNELLLVSGYSGIGKSAFIHETHKSITEKNGYFVHGKFEEFQKNIPLSAIIKAFNRLLDNLLTEPEAKLQEWKQNITKSLGVNAQVLVDIIPDLELIIGKQNPVPELEPMENQNRFNNLFHNFLSVFTRKDHPIVLFLDDLQWADNHSLNLIKELTINSESKYLLIIGAYRDNEINEVHPLTTVIEEIKKTNKEITNIHLSPLNRKNVLELLKDSLHLENENKLTTLVDIQLRKVGGNPFFLKEFLRTLYKEEIINYDHNNHKWQWDEAKILNYPLTENVIDLMVNNLKKLPKKAIDIISYASCLGNEFNLEFLATISDASIENVAINLWILIEEGMIVPLGKAQSLIQLIIEKNSLLSKEDLQSSLFKFQHDRVQQAAYTFIEEKRKKEVHLKIARLLLSDIDKVLLEEKILDITSHYILAFELVETYEEKILLIELNLKASHKAKSSTAYETAKTILLINEKLITNTDWKHFYELVFKSKLLLAEIFFLLGDYETSEKYFIELLAKTNKPSEHIKIYMIQMIKYHLEGKLFEELNIQIKSLQLLGESVPATDELIQAAIMDELAQIYQLCKDKNEKDILSAPLIMNVEQISILKILSKVWVTSYTVSKQNLVAWSSLRMTRISLENGISEFTGFGYVSVAVVLAMVGDYKMALSFGNYGLKTCEMFHNSVNIQTYFLYSLIFQWNDHIRNARELYNKFHLLSKEFGDYIYECFAIMFYFANACYWGENITDLYKKAIKFEKVQERIFPSNIALYRPTCVQYLACLQGLTYDVGSLNSENFDEDSHLKNFSEYLAIQTWTLIPKLQVLFIFSMYTDAYKLALRADEFAAVRPGQYVVAVLYFFSSLAILQNMANIESEEEKDNLLKTVNTYQEKLKLWASLCEANFLNKYLLVEAELERVKGNGWGSIEHYTNSIRLSNKYEFVNDEAMANELFALFWLQKENTKVASIYMKEAYRLYNEWGANGKCDQLERKYSELLQKENFQIQLKENHKIGILEKQNSDLANTGSFFSSNSIDITSIIDASQAISKEIEYEKLIAKLVKILLENAGAERVVLFSFEKENLYMEAVGTSENKLFFSNKPIPVDRTNKQIPFSVIQYVSRTNKSVVLNNAALEGQFTKDEYIAKQNVQSILCAPLLSKGKLMGLIYLENNLSAGTFTENRVETIQTLASQAAISIENAKLYKNIEIVTREQTRVATEFEIAEKIQTALLIKEFKIEGYEIAAYMQACDKIGGDYYDVIQTNGYEWFVIGDVSGHGLTAGLIMMMVQTSIRSIISGGLNNIEDLPSLIKRVNHVISGNIQKMNLKNYMYMTLTLFLKKEDTFYFSGLHQDILIYRNKTKSIERIETDGSWIGLEAIFNTFFVSKFDLESGDVLFLYTDGVTEASHLKTEEFFGMESLEKFLIDSEHESAAAIRNNLLRILENYKSNDDITFMVVYKK